MKFVDILTRAWKNLWRNRYRSILTIIAVAIGSSSIILMASFAFGSEPLIQSEMTKRDMDLNKVTIYGKEIGDQNLLLSEDDYTYIQNMDNIESSSIHKESYDNVSIKYKKYSGSDKLVGTNMKNNVKREYYKGGDFKDINGAIISYDFFHNFGIDKGETQIILDKIIGEEININLNIHSDEEVREIVFPVRIDGILSKDLNTAISYDALGLITVPIERIDKIIKDMEIEFDIWSVETSEISIYTNSINDTSELIKQLHRLNYSTYSSYETLQQVNYIIWAAALILGSLGLITLITALISVINTMMISVLERRKEIGIMKAIGADIFTIKLLFLIEASYIGMIGGIIGSIISMIVSLIINTIYRMNVDLDTISIEKISSIPPYLFLLTIAISIILCYLAGRKPSKRAIKLETVEVLKSE